MVRKSAFVTGSTGFLGLNLVDRLVKTDWDVVALHRSSSDLSNLRKFPVELVEGDITRPDSLKRAIPQGIDVVFHVAADTSMWSRHNARQTEINVAGTANMLQAARKANVGRFIHTSTWNTYGLEQGEISESSPQLGGSSWINYNRTKFRAEKAVRDAISDGLDAVIVNPCHIMGRYDGHGWARIIINLCNRWIPFAPPGAGTFCHAREAAMAHIAAAERGRVGQNYLLSGEFASLVEVLRTIGAITHCKAPKRTLPAAAFRFAARASVILSAITGKEPELTPEGVEMVCISAKVVSTLAQEELGYEPAPLDTAIRDSVIWLKAQGRLNMSAKIT